ncbi:MAG: hypothetical protein K2P81_06215 [Bacteriovoracaceae bacterium]|nr:hypothetical protein [Bacteriovoracaceae bacterium]
MGEAPILKQDSSDYLDNISWSRESFLNGSLVFHTISNQKVSDKVMTKLEENNYKLVDVKKDQSLTLVNKNMIDATEIQEVQLEKLKVTEASIVSHKNSSGKTTRLVINESAPSSEIPQQLKAPQIDLKKEKKKLKAEFRKVENEVLVYRQEITRKKNSFFFRAKDGPGLFKLGNSYYEAFKDGTHQFSFSHLKSDEAQKRSILGIASFIHYHENLKILIVCASMNGSIFSSFKTDENRQEMSVSAISDFQYDVYCHEGLNYLEVSEIREKSIAQNIKDQVYLMQNLFADYDLVLFDLPDPVEMKEYYDTYFPILQIVKNVSLIVGLEKSTFTEIHSLKEFFENYKVKINGVIVSQG